MKNRNRLNFAAPAPEVVLADPGGNPVRLASLWAEKPLLLAFTRHFGCTQCKEILAELVAGRETIEKAGLGIAVIMQGTPEATGAFAERFAPGMRVLADPERKAYQAYGIERGGVFQTFLNTRVWAAIGRARRKGWKVEPPPAGQDAMQMSGTFIISREGRILLPFYYDNIADHPPLDLLIDGVLSTHWSEPFDGPVGPGVKKAGKVEGRRQ